MLARLAAQIDVVQKVLTKRTPRAARRSRFGVWMIALPAQPSISHR
jgi:hypothetical protein